MPFVKGHKGLIGEENPKWKGDSVGYIAIHSWVRRWRGIPLICSYCGANKNLDWANLSKKYLRDLNDWQSLCKSCHHRFDNSRKKMWDTRGRKTHCVRGHAMTPDNLYFHKDGRCCKSCKKENAIKQRMRNKPK